MAHTALTFKRLRQALQYNPVTGDFTWLINRPRKGTKINTRRIQIDGIRYLTSRLAYFWMTGNWPKEFIDHIDGNEKNNRWKNLRPATRSQNGANSRTHHDKLIPFKGVTVSKKLKLKPYIAQIRINRCKIYLGCFKSAKDAHIAYCKAAKKFFGAYARLR